MTVRRFSVAVTTAADGSATAYSPYLSGYIAAIHYQKTDYTDGVDFTITLEATGESLWTEANVNAAASRYPRSPTHTGAGVASLAASTSAPAFAQEKPDADQRIAELERELGISGIVKLASNENPLGMSPKAKKAVEAAPPPRPDGHFAALAQWKVAIG